MSVAKQLYQLQEVDLEVEGVEQAIRRVTGQLAESQALIEARNRISDERLRLDELRKVQRSLEWETEDLAGKVAKAEADLYSGRIRNPKELSGLQHEVEMLKAKRAQFDNRALEVMEQAEQASANLNSAESAFKAVESEWRQQQQQLSADLDRLKVALSDLTLKRQELSAGIEPGAVDVYRELRRQRGTAVARVEQGVCRGCRISLPVSELQRVRSGNLVRCGSCGRILYLA